MITFNKQSMIDYSVQEGGKHIGWITKQKDGTYTVTLCGQEYAGFRYLKDAKAFCKE